MGWSANIGVMTMTPRQWRYGDAGDRWNVQTGDVWAVDHDRVILVCGDLERGAGVQAVQECHEPVSMIYVDPPWDQGNANAFRTKAGLASRADFERLIDSILDLFIHTGACGFMEVGKRRGDWVIAQIAERGMVVSHVWDITYYRRDPCRLVGICHDDQTAARMKELELDGVDDEKTPALTIQWGVEPGGIVFDPCMGRGLTMRSALECGARALGVELHPRRLAVCLDWCARQGMSVALVKRGDVT